MADAVKKSDFQTRVEAAPIKNKAASDQFAETSRQKLDEYTKQLQEMNKQDPDLSTRLQALSDRLDTAKREYDESSNINKWAEVAETVGHALTRMGAAQAGGSAWDSSQIQLPKTNWEAKQERIDKKYGGETSSIAKQQEGLLGRAEKQEESARRSLSDLLKQEYDNLQQADKLERQGKLEEARDSREAARRATEQANKYRNDLGLVRARGEEDRKTQAEKPVKENVGRQSPEEKKLEREQQALNEGLSYASSYQQADSKLKRQLAPKIGQSLGRAGLNPKVSSFLTNPEGTGGYFSFDKVKPQHIADALIGGLRSKKDVEDFNKSLEPYSVNAEASSLFIQSMALGLRGDRPGATKLKIEADTILEKAKKEKQ